MPHRLHLAVSPFDHRAKPETRLDVHVRAFYREPQQLPRGRFPIPPDFSRRQIEPVPFVYESTGETWIERLRQLAAQHGALLLGVGLVSHAAHSGSSSSLQRCVLQHGSQSVRPHVEQAVPQSPAQRSHSIMRTPSPSGARADP